MENTKLYILTNTLHQSSFGDGESAVVAFKDSKKAQAEADKQNLSLPQDGSGGRVVVREVAVEEGDEVVDSDGKAYDDPREAMNAAIEEMKASQERIAKIAQDAFSKGAKLIFDNHPNLDSFAWNQYTPYFNDGDTCYFRVSSDFESMKINGEDVYDWEYDSRRDGGVGYHHPDFPDGTLASDLENLIGSFEEDTLLKIFGDHVEVTIARGGKTSVEEYDHE